MSVHHNKRIENCNNKTVIVKHNNTAAFALLLGAVMVAGTIYLKRRNKMMCAHCRHLHAKS